MGAIVKISLPLGDPRTGGHWPDIGEAALQFERMPGTNLVKLTAPLVYVTSWGKTLTVPVGYVTNLYSIPTAIKWAFGRIDAKYGAAAALHDWLYDGHVLDRDTCDDVLFEAMLALGASEIEAWIVWSGVRAGGWVAWDACGASMAVGVKLSTRRQSCWMALKATRTIKDEA